VLLALASSGLWAQARITQALVYPGGAEVQRVQAVPAGAREVVLACIPDRYDTDAFVAQGGGGVRTGELRVQTIPKAAAGCSGDAALDAQIQALEDQIAGVNAERQALDLHLGYLKDVGKGGFQPTTGDVLRRQGLEALKQKNTLQRQVEQLTRQLQPLLQQRQQEGGDVGAWLRVTVQVDAPQAGELRLSGRTTRAGWQPSYRADLQRAASQVQVERLAEVQQTTGERWRDVQLVLSTRRPDRAMGVGEPAPWLLSKREPRLATLYERAAPPPPVAMAAPADARPRLEQAKVTGSRIDQPLPSFESDFDLQFTVPGATTVASGNERRHVRLDRLSWPAEVVAHVQPQDDAQAFVLATVARPEGFFPPGMVQLLRDGQFVGRSHWAPGQEAQERLFFGPDDRVRVRVEPQRLDGANAGFIGSRKAVTVQRALTVTNASAKPLVVQVLDVGPVPQHQDIQVQSRHSPEPVAGAWRELPGTRLWRLSLAPQASQRLTATHQLSAPKDMAVDGWPE
jgi:uncharacterized protein (TIGR02231 family)